MLVITMRKSVRERYDETIEDSHAQAIMYAAIGFAIGILTGIIFAKTHMGCLP